MGSLYFNHALQQHFKLLTIKENKKRIAFEKPGSLLTTVNAEENKVPCKTRQQTNWLV